MKKMKTTYWLILVIGLLSIVASVYFYFKGRPFDTYLFNGILGFMFAILGCDGLRKLKKSGKE